MDKFPKCVQAKAKKQIRDIYMADTRENVEKAYHLFIKSYEAKYPKATECLSKDRESMLVFYDFPTEHWQHTRTTNPIESTHATVRLRTARVRGCFFSQTVMNMACKLCQSAEKGWRKLRGYRRLAEVFEGVSYINGISERGMAA